MNIKLSYEEIIDMRSENEEPSCYAVKLRNQTIGFLTLYSDGWNIEVEEENRYKTLKVCKSLSNAKKAAEELLTADIIKVRHRHRLTEREMRNAIINHNFVDKLDVICYLIGYYGYIDNDDLSMIYDLYKNEDID